ncbi:hypothetical protein AVEN_213641-1 [Araneus ventricosus]|uniref:Uncharacterized protein n=1 Tax=Araneus ventricosus TaxID=182803 RepID=A0A4Y2LDT6_ARAVE|nr:hypothetical protein AVEN_213641-1 [Araneus ventricosus]
MPAGDTSWDQILLNCTSVPRRFQRSRSCQAFRGRTLCRFQLLLGLCEVFMTTFLWKESSIRSRGCAMVLQVVRGCFLTQVYCTSNAPWSSG